MAKAIVENRGERRGLEVALHLDRRSQTPVYRQVYGLVRDAIARGVLKPGDRLPSTRSLASQLATARGTIDLAYSLLLNEGYVQARGAAGTFVAADLPQALPASDVTAPARRDAAPAASGVPPLRPFEMGLPALDAFPRKLWSRLASRRARTLSVEALWRVAPSGRPALKEAIAAYLAVSRSIRCSPDQVFVTAGFQGALGLATRAFLRPGDGVWFEDPGYFLARGGFEAAGARLIPLPVDGDGLDIAAGLAQAPDAKMAYLTPSHQAPLGVALSLRRRMDLLTWAKDAQAWVLEDDYDSEFRYGSRPLPPLKSLDEADRVLFAGSFSKVLFPGLSLGYLVVPTTEIERVSPICQGLHPAPPSLNQAVAADFILEGHLGRHIRRMRALYAERRAALASALEETFGGQLELKLQAGGMHLIAEIRDGTSDVAQCARAKARGLGPMALSSWSLLAANQKQGLVLSFTNTPPAAARDQARRLKAALED